MWDAEAGLRAAHTNLRTERAGLVWFAGDRPNGGAQIGVKTATVMSPRRYASVGFAELQTTGAGLLELGSSGRKTPLTTPGRKRLFDRDLKKLNALLRC